MKVLVGIFCWLLVAYSIYFPCTYFHSALDKKEIRVSHILVDTEEEAANIKKELDEDKNKTFEEMAEKYSKCESKSQKGDIGYNERGRLLKDFEDQAYKMDKNIVYGPIKTQVGWHLVKISDIKYFSTIADFKQFDVKI